FGALVKVQETEGGIVTEIAVVDGKNDGPLLVPAVEGHGRVFGRPPGLVAVDRGFYSTDGERRVRALGVHHAVIPKPGFRSRERIDHERQRWFRRGRAWRAGGEARIARSDIGSGGRAVGTGVSEGWCDRSTGPRSRTTWPRSRAGWADRLIERKRPVGPGSERPPTKTSRCAAGLLHRRVASLNEVWRRKS